MTAEMTIAIEAEDSIGELYALRAWLRDEDGLRANIRLDQGPPAPNTLGPVLDTLTVICGSGGAVAVLSSALVAWVRHRGSDVTCTVTRPDGTSIEMNARRLRTADASAVGRLIEELSGTEEPRPHGTEEPGQGT